MATKFKVDGFGRCFVHWKATANDPDQVAVVGKYAVGKTTLLMRIVEKVFQETISPTLGSDAIVYAHDDSCEIVFTDTAGEERFKVLALLVSFFLTHSFFFFSLVNRP